MSYDITFSVPEKNGKCAATLHETDEQGNKTGKNWNAAFNYNNMGDPEKMAILKTNLYDQVRADEADAAKQNELRDAAISAELITKPVAEAK